MPRISPCPPAIEDYAEAYCLKRLSPWQARSFEDHFVLCPDCAAVVSETEDFLRCFRAVYGETNLRAS